MYQIKKLEKKSNDWYILSLQSPQGQIEDNVSVNRTNKKGEVFPNFDTLKEGGTVEGKFWKSDAGKSYLFAAPTYSAPKSGIGGGMGAKLVAEKSKNIEHAQDRKSESIMVASTASQATEILTALMSNGGIKLDGEEYKAQWIKIRYWLVKNWNNIEQPKIGSTDVDYPQSGIDDFDTSEIPF